MYKDVQNRKLNVGLIIAAVWFFAAALYMFYNVVTTFLAFLEFSHFTMLDYWDVIFLPVLEPISFIGFGIYILVGYKNGKYIFVTIDAALSAKQKFDISDYMLAQELSF